MLIANTTCIIWKYIVYSIGLPRELHQISRSPWLFYWSAGRIAQNIFKSLSFYWFSQRTAPNIYKSLAFLLVRREDCTKHLQVLVFSLVFPEDCTKYLQIIGFSTGPPGGLHKTSSSACLLTGVPRGLHLISTNAWFFYQSARRIAQNFYKSVSFLVFRENCSKYLEFLGFSTVPPGGLHSPLRSTPDIQKHTYKQKLQCCKYYSKKRKRLNKSASLYTKNKF